MHSLHNIHQGGSTSHNLFQKVYAFSDTFLKYLEFWRAKVRLWSASLDMAIAYFKITPLPHEGKQFWSDYYIHEADPNDIAVIELTQGFKAIVGSQQKQKHRCTLSQAVSSAR